MNSVTLVGRLTRDPDIRYSQGQEPMCIARFTVAVDRRFKRDGQPSADFPSCIAFGKTGEFIEKYFRKGMKIGLTGRLQTGSYDHKDGYKVYTTDVVVENAEFVESKKSQAEREGQQPPPEPTTDVNGFMEIPDDLEEELPFA